MERAALRERLESLTSFTNVFPTARAHANQRSALAAVADALETRNVAQVEEFSFVDAVNVLSSEVSVTSSAVPQLLELADGDEQLVGFARAGFNFFQADPSYGNEPLEIRRARGGNGAVTRVLASDGRIALETRRLVVGFEDLGEDEIRQFFRSNQLVPIRHFRFGGPAWHVIADGGLATDVCLQLLEMDEVRYAEPDFIEHVNQRTLPADPLIGQQWHHRVLGLPDIWPSFNGEGVRLAVVDNGFMVAHPDLDPDAESSGWFRSSPDGDDALLIPGLDRMRSDDHGTACAGMATARSNDTGGIGVAFGATLHVVACLEDQIGTQVTLARALAYAADPQTEGAGADVQGADVIACSLGPNGAVWKMSNVLSDAIDFVTEQGRDDKGSPVLWASTNGNFPISSDEVCSHPKVICVGRSTETDTDDGSGFGPELAFLAPGVDVLIPSSNGMYRVTTGTSFACPCAAGVAALVLEKDPDLTAAEVGDRLRASCQQIGDLPYVEGRNDTFGSGRLDPALALGIAE